LCRNSNNAAQNSWLLGVKDQYQNETKFKVGDQGRVVAGVVNKFIERTYAAEQSHFIFS